MKLCNSCNKSIDNNSKYCTYCGTPQNGRVNKTLQADCVIFYDDKTNKHGIIDKNSNSVVLQPEFDIVQPISSELFIISRNNLFGISNTNGEILVPVENVEIRPIYKDFFIVKKDREYALFNNGIQVSPFKYSSIGEFKNGLALVTYDSYESIINSEGIDLCLNKYDTVFEFYKEVSIVINKSNLFGLINQKGEEILPCEYSYIKEFEYPITLIIDHRKKYGVINARGEVIIPIKYGYDRLKILDDNVIAVYKYPTWRFYDNYGDKTKVKDRSLINKLYK